MPDRSITQARTNDVLTEDDRVPLDLLRPCDSEAMTASCVDPGTAVTTKEASLFDSL